MEALKQLRFGRLEGLVALTVFIGGLLVAAAAGAFSGPLTPAPTPAGPASPAPAMTLITPAPTATAIRLSIVEPTAAGTSTPARAEPALPAPTATWFYIAPHTLDFAPTPALPAAAPFPTSCDGPGRMNILVVGLDGFSQDYTRPARADTVMVLGVNFAARSAQLLSIPRDLWLPMPNGIPVTEARINTAYHYGELYGVPGGGPGQLSATLESAFGLRIDRHLVVSFLAFEQGVDAIGGIEIDIPEPIHDPAYPMRSRPHDTMAIDFPAGRVQMDGGTALIYARIRHDSSDFQRMRRQQQVIFAIRDKLLAPETLPHLPALAQLLLTSVRTDLTLDDIALLGCLGPQIERGSIQTLVLDARLTEARQLDDGAQVLLPKMDAILPLLQAFNSGD